VTKSIDEAYVALAGAHNDVALMSIAALEPDAAFAAGRDAVGFARRGIDSARTAETNRQAIVELIVGHVWSSDELGIVDALDMFRATDPTAEDVFDAFTSLRDRVQRFEDLRGTGREEVRGLRRLMETFAAGAVDASLRERGGKDGFSERHHKVLRAVHRYDHELDCTVGSREIWHKCRAAGLDHYSTNKALHELTAAGVLEQRPGSGGFGPRYIPTWEGRQVIPQLGSQPPTRQAVVLAA